MKIKKLFARDLENLKLKTKPWRKSFEEKIEESENL